MRWHSPKMPKWNSASNSEQLNMRHYMHNNISPLLKLYFHFPLIIWGELIKDMTNWLLLSENFIWLQIWVFILVEFSKCSTKTFSPELLSAFLGAFFLSLDFDLEWYCVCWYFVSFTAIAGCRYGAVVNTTGKAVSDLTKMLLLPILMRNEK